LGPIGSAVLTFIGYKQTNRHPDKPNLYIEEYIKLKLEGFKGSKGCKIDQKNKLGLKMGAYGFFHLV